MAPVKQKRPMQSVHKKRHGAHHKKGNHYLKVYWPYVPMLMIVIIGLAIGNWKPVTKNGVLAYATDISIATLLSETNEERQNQSKSRLSLNSSLTAAAQAKANDMTKRNYWSHATPDGKDPWVFVQAAGYAYQKAGENLAYGFESSQDTVAGWMNSASHRQNLLDASYQEVGFGFANAKDFNKSGPETVVVAMYGRPVSSQSVNKSPMESTPSSVSPVNSNTPLIKEPATLGIARIQTLTKGQTPWAVFGIGLASGVMAAYLLLKHAKAFRKLAVEGEEFFIHHPMLDILFISLVMTGYVLSQASGVIR